MSKRKTIQVNSLQEARAYCKEIKQVIVYLMQDQPTKQTMYPDTDRTFPALHDEIPDVIIIKQKIRRYNKHAGNPMGVCEDTKRCIVEVVDGWHYAQCSRKRGHGVGGKFCMQHAKMMDEKGRNLSIPEKE